MTHHDTIFVNNIVVVNKTDLYYYFLVFYPSIYIYQ